MSESAATDPDGARDPVDLLSEAFLQRRRAGDGIDVETFAAQHPEHAAALQELLPTLLLLERIKRQEESSASGLGRPRIGTLQKLGDFRIEREIGRGGMGVVFEAVQEALDRHVALKVLPQSHLLTGHQLERFRREAQTAARLHHSHIVPVFGCGEADGYHYYAMQYIDGAGLDRWIVEQREQAAAGDAAVAARCRTVARFCVDVAQALHHAHAQGTLHRDVKPSNLLLDRDGHVWVTDFGLAKALEQGGLTVSGDLLGTLQYMAPEQFRGLYDERSEVYALGLSLYELLALRPAFSGRTRSELIEKIQNGRPERLQRLLPAVPRDLATIVEMATARDPADRYADAGALASDLERFLQDRPIRARRHSPRELLWRWCRHHRALAAMAASIAALVLLAATFGWIMYGVTRDALSREKTSAIAAHKEEVHAKANLDLALEAFEKVFDSMVGPDPFHAFEEDADTGEYSGVVRTVVDPRAAALLQTVLAFYDRFAAENAGDLELLEKTAHANRRVGGIQFRLGHLDEAEKAYERALQLYADVHTGGVHLDLANIHLDLAKVSLARDGPDDAQEHCRLALRILDAGPGSKRQRFEAAQAHVLLLWAIAWPGADPYGEPLPERPPGQPRRPLRPYVEELGVHIAAAEQLLGELLRDDADNPEFLELRARLLRFQARPRAVRLPRDADPAPAYDEALAILRDLVQRFPDADHYRFELVDTLLMVPGERRPGQEDGEPRLREALTLAAQLVAQQPDIPTYQNLLARAQTDLGRQLMRKGQPEAAVPLLAAALQHARGQLPARLNDDKLLVQTTVLRVELAHALHALHRDDEARTLAAEAVGVGLDLLDRFDQDRAAGGGRGDPLTGLGRLLALRFGPPEARPRGELLRLLDDFDMRDAEADRLRGRLEDLRPLLEARRRRGR